MVIVKMHDPVLHTQLINVTYDYLYPNTITKSLQKVNKRECEKLKQN